MVFGDDDDVDPLDDVPVYRPESSKWNAQVHCVGYQRRCTEKQRRRIGALRATIGFYESEWRARILGAYGKETTFELSHDEADDFIEKLERRIEMHGTLHAKRQRQEERLQRDVDEIAAFFREMGVIK